METVVHSIRELDADVRLAVEMLVGHAVRDDQQIMIQVVQEPLPVAANESQQLPEWCNVYAGLSDAEIDDLELSISRRLDLTRNHV